MNSNDVDARAAGPRLPADTVLSFFYDLPEERWGFDPADAGHWRVLVAPVESAVPVTGPESAESFPAAAVDTVAVSTIPEPHLCASAPGLRLAGVRTRSAA
ncbi:hypothetical protein Asi02nite_63920 [Asanoa siamensis]|uniref:Uncharacterized protein n=1 Tax=Asanoa siamensis TaxID=926357 RepID=A0ABQ4D002_9ACTN|nr:hypothetical protein Asi02nite_63920 [Asanoa siamensis]